MPSAVERVLIISDLHAPYVDQRALRTALDYARDERVHHVVINGDLIDCAMISRFDKRANTPSLTEEIESGRDVLATIRQQLPRARITYRLGNHEERLEHYLMRHAQEIARLGVVTIASLLRTDAYGVRVIDARQERLQLGKLSVMHGHEVNTYASINVAHAVLRRVMCNVIVGHWHRCQTEILRTYKGDFIGCWVTGCLCDLEPDYAPVNQWQHGFAIVSVYKSGRFHVSNRLIIRGEVL